MQFDEGTGVDRHRRAAACGHAVGEIVSSDGLAACSFEGQAERGAAINQRSTWRSRGIAVAGAQRDGVRDVCKEVESRIDRADGDVESGAGCLGGWRSRFPGWGSGRSGFAREQNLQVSEGASAHRDDR